MVMISIITPSYNQGEFIEKTIQSVLSQDVPDLEYVVVDGGSIDNTVDILNRYTNKLRFISEKDRGQTHAINKGLLMTSGDIIGWVNSDDIYYPNAIKKICDYFEKHPDVDVIYGDANYINRDGKIISLYPTEKWNIERFKIECFISQPATFFRRRVVERYGVLDENLCFCMDYEYWLRLGMMGARLVYLPSVMAGSRMYPETKTASCCVEANVEAIKMLEKKLGYIPIEWQVKSSIAYSKAKGLSLYQPQFLLSVWQHLWKVAGQRYSSFSRVIFWCAMQKILLLKFLRRMIKKRV